jgi:group I intron endonuclease
MKIAKNSIKNLDKQGVYFIVNMVNNRIYVGGTTMTFYKRFLHHYDMLKANKHKNNHLQNAWNLYKEDNFIFVIKEICTKDLVFEKEQVWLSYFIKNKKAYNINSKATGTPNLSKETIEKRTLTFIKTTEQAMLYYRKVKSGDLTIEDVPVKFKKIVKAKLIYVPVTKGKKLSDTSHLKVPKTKSESFMKKYKKISEDRIKLLPEVSVYTKDDVFIGKWKNIYELQEWSKHNQLPVDGVFKKDRMGVSKYFMSVAHTKRAIVKSTTYKGLKFKVNESTALCISDNTSESDEFRESLSQTDKITLSQVY